MIKITMLSYKIFKTSTISWDNINAKIAWGRGEEGGGGGGQFDPPVVFRKMFLLKRG